MKKIRILCVTLFMAIFAAMANAQSAVNIFEFKDIKVQAGKNARLPFELDNQDNVAAIQFDLILPAGIKLDGGVQLSSRAKKTHTITASEIGNAVRVVILSNKNRFISDNVDSKELVYVDVSVPQGLSSDETYKPEIQNLVLSDINGNNLPCDVKTGEISIAKMPDLQISDLQISGSVQELNPGETVKLLWNVSNIGELPTTGGFTEEIYIVGLDGATRYLASTSYSKGMAAGDSLTRSTAVTLPSIPNVDGLCLFVVKIVPNSDCGEPTTALANNEMQTEQQVFVSKYLTLGFPSELQEAPYHDRIWPWTNPYRHSATITRSGSRLDSQYFTLKVEPKDGNNRFSFEPYVNSMEKTIVIPEGQTSASFYYWFFDNSLLDNDSLFTVTLTGGGYDQITQNLKLKDDETPKLFISLDKTEVKEGESFSITVTTERVSQKDITVRLTANKASRFELPETVTIPAGKTYVKATGKAVDNNVPQLDETLTLRTSSTGYTSQTVSIKILDKYITQLALNFNQNFITESDDSTLVLTVTRSTNIDKRVVINLSDNNSSLLKKYSRQVVMEAGVESVDVAVVPQDNSIVDYTRKVNMFAHIYLEANSQNAPSASPGYAAAELDVLDDDGLTLSIRPARSTWAEGGNGYVLYISRNTTSAEPGITVTLTNNQPDRFSYNQTVEFAKGESSKTVYVSVLRNNIPDDNITAVFTAEATDYNMAKCQVYVSDTSHPDATISGFSLSNSSVEITSPFTATAVVENIGYDILPAETEIKVYSGRTEIAAATLGEDLDINGKATIEFPLTAVGIVGTTEYHAVVNPGNKLTEMSYGNNTSKSAYLYTSPGFYVKELKTDKILYMPGETVKISGSVVGNHAADAPLLIHILWKSGSRTISHTISANCDHDGTFEEEWLPYANLAGHIDFGATHPSVGLSTDSIKTGIDIYGLRLQSGSGNRFDVEEEHNKDCDIVIYNPGPTLTGVKAEVVTKPANCNITLDNANISTFGSGNSATIKMHITNTTPSQKVDYDSILVRVITDNNLEVEALNWFHCRYHNAHLQVIPSRYDITITKGTSRKIQVDLTNNGLRESGKVTASSSNSWVSDIGYVAELQPNDTTTATIELTAPDDINLVGKQLQPLYVSFACANGSGTSLQINVRVVAEEKGRFILTACDDDTYNKENHPHLQGATVTVTNAITGAVVCSGITNEDGQYIKDELVEGYYNIKVTCNSPKAHYPFTKSRFLINPGVDNELEAMLWIKNSSGLVIYPDPDNPEPDTCQVKYDVVVDLDTDAPAITMTLPKNRPSLNVTTQIDVHNKGSVPVGKTDIQFLLPQGYYMEIIDRPFVNAIQPHSTASFFGVLRLTEDAPDDADPSVGCFHIGATTHAKYVCGPHIRVIETTARNAWGNCSKEELETWTDPSPNPDGGDDPSPSLPSGRIFTIDGIDNNVSLQLSRTTMMTKQTIQAYLTINNKANKNIEGISFDLSLLNVAGQDADTLFNYELTSLSAGMVGGNTLAGKWMLNANSKGIANINLAPVVKAAENQPRLYYIGGTMHYTDPTTQQECHVKLIPIPVYVNPMPVLDLRYFLQRDIYGDDLLTTNVKEPSLPAEFSLLINNSGSGVASKVNIVTCKPQVVSTGHTNIGSTLDFKFIGSQLNGAEMTPNVLDDITTNFGTIKNGQTAYAQWWMSCNYMGHFADYNVNTILAAEDLSESVLGDISVHELIHSLNIDMSQPVPLKGFLVNDEEDEEDLPDKLYLTNDSIMDVYTAIGAKITKKATEPGTIEYVLSVTPSSSGWNYGTVSDPTRGRYKLQSIKRLSDSKEIDAYNFWQTDRTMPDGSAPIYENLIHFADEFAQQEVQEYQLSFAYNPEEILDVKEIIGLPDSVLQTPLKSLEVVFTKDIKPETFTAEDLTITRQGVEVKPLTIDIKARENSAKEFKLDLSNHTAGNGLYILTLNTEGIRDYENFPGETLRIAEWMQFQGGMVSLSATALPEIGGKIAITPEPEQTNDADKNVCQYKYATEVTLKAEPADGYEFSHWELIDAQVTDGEVASTDAELKIRLFEDHTYVAHFVPRRYLVEVLYNKDGGNVDGAGTGLYGYGEQLNMTAKILSGCRFEGWRIDGQASGSRTDKKLSLTVQTDRSVEACFNRKSIDYRKEVPQGWSWITPNVLAPELQEPKAYLASVLDNVERLVDVTTELIYDPGFEQFVGNLNWLTPSSSYKLKMKQDDVIEFYGRISFSDEKDVRIHSGWNWMGYVPAVEMNLNTALAALNPVEGDVIKSKTAVAEYNDGQWVGTLQTLCPTEGYMYLSKDVNSVKNFRYPNNNSYVVTAADRTPLQTPATLVPWSVDINRYPDNVTMIATLATETITQTADTYIIGAFVGDECRGIGTWVDGRLFITIQGSASDHQITLRAYNKLTRYEYDVAETLDFSVGHAGSVKAPRKLHIGTATRLAIETAQNSFTVNPNPVTNTLHIIGNVDAIQAVTVLAISGTTQIPYTTYDKYEGLNVTALTAGHYILGIKTQTGVIYKRFIKIYE